MFVYKKGRLIHTNKKIGTDRAVLKLFHPSSSMGIEVTYNTNPDKPSLDTSFIVTKEVAGQYVIYEEFYQDGKTLVKTFEEAISFFENNIYEQLNETPPTPEAPTPTPTDTFQELPEVGDIIKVGTQFSIVTDIDGSKVTAKKMSKDEAMKTLRNKRNADLSNIAKEMKDIGFAKGGALDNPSDSVFVEYDNDKDRIIILRADVDKPQGTPPPDGEEPEPPSNEPTPNNIQNPFDQESDSENGDSENGDSESGDSESGDSESGDSESGDSESGDSEGGDSESGDSESGDDSESGKNKGDSGNQGDNDGDSGNQGRSDNNDDENGTSNQGVNDEFGNSDDDFENIEDLINNIDFASNNPSDSDIGSGDLVELELFLGLKADDIKRRFKTKSLVKTALGSTAIFDFENNKRLEKVLNEIFD